MGMTLYEMIRLLGRRFRFSVIGLEHILPEGPAIFVANHLGSLGPIEMILSVPVRFYPWVIAEMMDLIRAPHYLYDDFVHPVWRLNGRTGMFVSYLVSRIAVRLLAGLGSVSVDRNRGWTRPAFERSLELLFAGKNLLIFPEDNLGPLDPQTQMQPFLCGFIGLCWMYQRRVGQALPVYPAAVHARSRSIAIGPAHYFRSAGQRRQDLHQFCTLLEQSVHRLYLDLDDSHPARVET